RVRPSPLRAMLSRYFHVSDLSKIFEMYRVNVPQYAYQSVWLTAKSREECPVCGTVHHRVDPRAIALRSVQADGIRAALNASRS
ncbi:MAG: hypothetical protein EAZ18_24700, partial [Oscillatoriales cyanobacterium]